MRSIKVLIIFIIIFNYLVASGMASAHMFNMNNAKLCNENYKVFTLNDHGDEDPMDHKTCSFECCKLNNKDLISSPIYVGPCNLETFIPPTLFSFTPVFIEIIPEPPKVKA